MALSGRTVCIYADTFPVAYPFIIHQQLRTQRWQAVYANLSHAKTAILSKQAVKSPQRNRKTTKRPIDKQRRSSQKSNDPTPVQTMQIKEIQIAGKQQQNHIFKIT